MAGMARWSGGGGQSVGAGSSTSPGMARARSPIATPTVTLAAAGCGCDERRPNGSGCPLVLVHEPAEDVVAFLLDERALASKTTAVRFRRRMSRPVWNLSLIHISEPTRPY